MKVRKWFRPSFSTILIFLFIIIWLIFAPVQLGGNKAYIIVMGNSMTPKFNFGDLVIVNEASRYYVGDVVAYTDPFIGPVFHRIIDYHGDSFVLQGDANDWLDPHTPTSHEIIGKLWLLLPDLGNYVRFLRQPTIFTVLVIAVAAVTFFPNRKGDTPKRKRKNRQKKESHMSTQRTKLLEVGITFGVVIIFSILFLVFSFSKPTTRIVDQQLVLNHTGLFEYSADAVDGVYDNPVAVTGEPVFWTISDTIDSKFVYTLSSEDLDGVQGMYQVIAEISDETGWKRTFKLSPMTEFVGNSFTVSSTIYFPHIFRVIDYFKDITGVMRNTFELSIKPQISVFGTYQNEEIRDEFTPSLNFQMNETMVWMSEGHDDLSPFGETVSSSLTVPVIEPNTVSFFAWQLKVLNLRFISSIILVAALGFGGWYGWQVYQVMDKDEEEQLDFFYGNEIVELTKRPNFDELIEVESFDELVELARTSGVKILHSHYRSKHHYYLPLDEGVYTWKV